MNAERVLFICVHNSGRSQMAEAFLNDLGKGRFHAESAGMSPTSVNPLVVEVMREIGMDLSRAAAHSVFDYFKQGRLYRHVITVCDESIENKCPLFPGLTQRMHWPFPDPAKLEGTPEEKLAKLRKIRDDIKKKVEEWLMGELTIHRDRGET
jgi:arsenate reductase